MADSLQDAIKQHQQGHLEQAAQHYKERLATHPNDSEVLHLLAIVYGQLQQLEVAEVYIKKALLLAPEMPSFYNSYANIAKYKGDMDLAKSLYARAIELSAYNPASHYNLGLIYNKSAHYTLAEQHLCTALQQKPDYLEAYEVLIRQYQQQQQFDQAAGIINQAQAALPDQVIFIKLAAQQAHYQHQMLEAIALYEQYIAQVDNDYDAHHHLAAAYLTQDNIQAATQHNLAALDLHPQHEETHHNLAVIYLTQNKLDLALKHWLLALSIRQHSDYLYNIGVVYNYKGQYTDALQYFEQCLQLEAEHYNSIVNIAIIYLKKQMPPEARFYFKKALAIKPDDEQNRYLVAALDNEQADFNQSPASYVTELFDQYANTFDSHLTKVLRYQAPEIFYRLLQKHIDIEQGDHYEALDIGCGTGLMAEKIHRHCRTIIGVDLSAKMIEQANKKGVYTRCVQADIVAFAKETTQDFDLITAADVFPYYGDLALVLDALYAILRPGGTLIYSVETHTEDAPYRLHTNGRFQHHEEYITRSAIEAGFQIVVRDNTSTRHEGPIAIDCMTHLLKK
jgi:predicted TPR repeat methyltransferase